MTTTIRLNPAHRTEVEGCMHEAIPVLRPIFGGKHTVEINTDDFKPIEYKGHHVANAFSLKIKESGGLGASYSLGDINPGLFEQIIFNPVKKGALPDDLSIELDSEIGKGIAKFFRDNPDNIGYSKDFVTSVLQIPDLDYVPVYDSFISGAKTNEKYKIHCGLDDDFSTKVKFGDLLVFTPGPDACSGSIRRSPETEAHYAIYLGDDFILTKLNMGDKPVIITRLSSFYLGFEYLISDGRSADEEREFVNVRFFERKLPGHDYPYSNEVQEIVDRRERRRLERRASTELPSLESTAAVAREAIAPRAAAGAASGGAAAVAAPRARVVEGPLAKAKTEAAIASFKKAAACIQAESSDHFAISLETAIELGKVADFLGAGSTVLATTAAATGVFGASPSFQRKVANAATSMQTAAAGFSALSRAGTMASFTGVLGFSQIALGAFSFIKSLFGAEEVNGFEVLQRQIGEMYQRVAKKLDQIHADVKALEDRMIRLEKITVKSAQEIYLKDLYGCIEKIKLDLSGEFTLSEEERRKVALKLITWLDMHARSPLVTGLIQEDASLEGSIKILEEEGFNLRSQLPLYLSIYHKVQQEAPSSTAVVGGAGTGGSALVGGAGTSSSPVKRYKIGSIEYTLDEIDNLTLLESIHTMLDMINNAWDVDVSRAQERARARLIKGNEIIKALIIEMALFPRQLRHLRLEIGKALHKKDFSLETKGFEDHEQRFSIFDLRKYVDRQAEFHKLEKKFQEESSIDLELLPKLYRLKELCLFHSHFSKDGISSKKWKLMEDFSKETNIIIDGKLCTKVTPFTLDAELYSACYRGDAISAEKLLSQGAAPAYTRRGTIHYDSVPPIISLFWNDAAAFYNIPKSPKIVELLIKAEIRSKDFEQPYGSPLAYARKHNQVGAMLVLAAIDPTLELKAEQTTFTPVGIVNSRMKELQTYLITEMLGKKAPLRREDFINAYKFYRDVDEGKIGDPKEVNEIPLMYLTACLGDTIPLKVLSTSVKYNGLQRIMDLAIIYKNEDVLSYILKNKASPEEKASLIANKAKMVELAKETDGKAYSEKIDKLLTES